MLPGIEKREESWTDPLRGAPAFSRKEVFFMATPHNAAKEGDIAKTVLLPGDPLRAKYIAETFLENPVQFNSVRNVLGFTGTYEGKPVSVMATGMGIPSIGIYTYELIHFYGCENLIRVGSAGAYQPDLKLGDIVLAEGACSDSNYADHFHLPGIFSATASFDLLLKAKESADRHGYRYQIGNVVSSDVFYSGNEDWKNWAKMGVLCAEMESYGLYLNAAEGGVKALGMFTISDSLVTHEEMSAYDRQTTFANMMVVALETAIQL
jgi:purine-nucleoside phosphorylase